MRAIQITEPRQPLRLADVPTPAPGPGEVLVRISAAGICHSDVHYSDGISQLARYPLTPGHEIAGTIVDVGPDPDNDSDLAPGARVCIHYLVTCGVCNLCRSGRHQWCKAAEMIGKDRDGGYAEYIVVPARNAIRIPERVPDAQAAVMMCSSATSLHAIRKARMQPGETVAVFGCGGLGCSAIQIANILRARLVIGIDRDPVKLEIAARLGATVVDASASDPMAAIERLTDGAGVDVALELVGVSATVHNAIASAGVAGRVALVGITNEAVPVNPYTELIAREIEMIGVSDHHPEEIRELLTWAADGRFDLGKIVTGSVGLEPSAIGEVFSQIRRGKAPPRTVIVP